MIFRPATNTDIPQMLDLYWDLTRAPSIGDAEDARRVLDHDGTHVFVVEDAGHVQAMVTLHLLPNVTWAARPYGLIENVVTRESARGRGFGRAALAASIAAARDANAYKLMLLTGQARDARGFYENLGFSADEKWGMTIRFG